MTDSPGGPPLLRPVPRRPFDLSLREPTPPDDNDSYPPSLAPQPTLNLDTLNSKLLDPRNNTPSTPGGISRAQSVLNLTSSTLMGIYSPTTYGKDRFFAPGDEPSTPWGTGAETPAGGLNVNELSYELHKERSHSTRRRSSLHPPPRAPPPLSAPASIFYLSLRVLLLSGLGVLYGLLAAQVQDTQRSAFHMDTVSQATSLDWQYMAFWGVSGVVLGSLLPWVDGVWEGVFGGDAEVEESAAQHTMGADVLSTGPPSTDWALAIRGIGMFVGIAFAIRKLPWDSTLQLSLTLALVNPVLWFLIDRSVPGFLVSSVVGLAGSGVLMGLSPDMVPVPTIAHSSSASSSTVSSSASYGTMAYGLQNNSASHVAGGGPTMILGGLANAETVATSIWLLNVLFCCCVCFGNIGRWLAVNRSATGKGRWGWGERH